VDFDAGRAAVVAAGPADAVVGRWPGLVCVAQSSDPAALAGLLDLCAAVAAEVGPAPGRALARRLAMWLGAGEGDDLRFGTLAVAGDRWAVFLSGSVELVVPEQDLALSGVDSAAWTDRLLPVPERPVALALEGVAVPPDMAGGVHDLRLGVVPGGGIVLVPGTGGAAALPVAAAASRPVVQPVDEPEDVGGPWTPLDGAPVAEEPYAAAEQQAASAYPPAEYVPAEYEPADVPAPAAEPAWDAPVPEQMAPVEGRHERPSHDGAPDPDEFATAHVGGWSEQQGAVGLEKPVAPPPAMEEPAYAGSGYAEPAHVEHAPAVAAPESAPLADDPGPPITPPGASTAVAGAVTPAVPPAAPPRRAERILGVAPGEPPRPPLDLGAPAVAEDGEERSETTVLDQQPKAQGHLCARGHLNDPRSHFCVLCGIRMNERTGVLVVGNRPPLGLLVFDDGSTYTVDAEYLVGRMPEADQRVRSGVLRAIIIEDRSGSVSRVHAEVRLNGWDVMLVDSGSRNGTYLSAPGEQGWTPLPPHQSRQLVSGTKVRLGARTFTFESPSGVR
jgi:FHA domain